MVGRSSPVPADRPEGDSKLSFMPAIGIAPELCHERERGEFVDAEDNLDLALVNIQFMNCDPCAFRDSARDGFDHLARPLIRHRDE